MSCEMVPAPHISKENPMVTHYYSRGFVMVKFWYAATRKMSAVCGGRTMFFCSFSFIFFSLFFFCLLLFFLPSSLTLPHVYNVDSLTEFRDDFPHGLNFLLNPWGSTHIG
jgi:hypothetical protein